jgi:hypothetical protein
MQTQKIKAIGLLSLVFILLVLAFWWGELGAAFDILLAIPASIVAGVAVVLLMKFVPQYFACPRLKRWWQYSLLALGLVAIFFASFKWGYTQYYTALNGCQAEGEQVRSALQRYHEQHQAYPASLKALNIATPCRRYLHPSLLFYRLTSSGYELTYSDWMMLYRATEASGFDAHK